MSSRRRQNHNQSQARSPSLPNSNRSGSPPSEAPSSQPESDDSSPTPFYNTTFSAHRVSPLYIGEEPLSSKRLQTIAHRLRDTLVGDVVRGVEVGLGADGGEDRGALGRAGALEAVEIRWVRMSSLLDIGLSSGRGGGRGDSAELGSDDGGGDEDGWNKTVALLSRKSALHIALRYEAASCSALLLPDLSEDGDGNGNGSEKVARSGFWVGNQKADAIPAADPKQFVSMPLLLLRMPAPLKAIIGDFISTSFDCRVSPLRLGTRSIVRGWESWIQEAGLPTRGPLAKDVVITLGFFLPPPEGDSGDQTEEDDAEQQGLKSIDIFIPTTELRKFVGAGRDSAAGRSKRKASAGETWEEDVKKRRKLAGRLHEEGWEWRKPSTDNAQSDEQSALHEQEFTEALGLYVDRHLGLNMFHPGVRITKIACGGFVMSEGRVKIFAPTDLGEAPGESQASSPGQRGAVYKLLRGLTAKAKCRDV